MINNDGRAEQLSELRLALQQWRTEGRPGRKIPSTIWDRSVALTASLGVAVVAKQVGLDYGLLRSRADNGREAPQQGDTSFVELFPPPSSKQLSGVIVCGGRIRVEIGGLDVSSLAALVRQLAGG